MTSAEEAKLREAWARVGRAQEDLAGASGKLTKVLTELAALLPKPPPEEAKA